MGKSIMNIMKKKRMRNWKEIKINENEINNEIIKIKESINNDDNKNEIKTELK